MSSLKLEPTTENRGGTDLRALGLIVRDIVSCLMFLYTTTTVGADWPRYSKNFLFEFWRFGLNFWTQTFILVREPEGVHVHPPSN